MKVSFFFVLFYCYGLHAQDSAIVIKAGASINESVAITDLYQYSHFVHGKVFFRSGDSGSAKLNYHKLLDEMQFIDPKGDTLNIANPGTIRVIRINDDMFYYDDGYVKLLKETNEIKLAEKQTLSYAGKTKTGAYDMASPASAIDTYGKLIDQKNIYNLVPREDITLNRKTQFYFGDKYNRFVWATRKNLLRHFSKESESLNKYLKGNNVDLTNRIDLEKLLQFLARL